MLLLLLPAWLTAACGDATTPRPEASCKCDASARDGARVDSALDNGTDGAVDRAVEGAANDQPAPAMRRPVVFVHGINGSSKDFDVMVKRLVADGWPQNRLFALTFKDPSWGCNADNAAALAAYVKDALSKTGATRIDLVAHSMGTLSSRYFVKNLGGASLVNTYVTLGGMHHGLPLPCLSPLDVCVWKELCSSGPFVTQLDAAPATPGQLHWVSIYGTADASVPNDSSKLTGAENIALAGVEHSGANGLLEHSAAYAEVKRVLGYPKW